MTGTVLEYGDDLERRLDALPKAARFAFVAWCCEPLYSEFAPSLSRWIGEQNLRVLRETIDEAWAAASESRDARQGLVDAALAMGSRVGWTEEEVQEHELRASEGAAQLLSAVQDAAACLQCGSARRAASVAKCLITCIDYDLAMVEGVVEPWFAPRMVSERQRLDDTISRLATGTPLIAERRALHPT